MDLSFRKPLVTRAAIIGVGLMGGSIGMALRSRNLVAHTVGFDSPQVLRNAIDAGAIDADGDCATMWQAVADANIVILAVPIHAMHTVLHDVAPHLQPGAVVTDIGSIKSSIAAWGKEAIGDAFIAGHPMAGSEKTGVANSRSDLFQGAAWALIQDEGSQQDSERLHLLSCLITGLGARPVITTASRHDRAAALISHLPHLISFAYNETIESDPEAVLAHQLAAGSYRDLTRVAASDPVLWRDVFLENREWLLCALARYRKSVSDIEEAILAGGPEALLERLKNAAK